MLCPFWSFCIFLVIHSESSLIEPVLSGSFLRSSQKGIIHKQIWQSYPNVHPAYNILINPVGNSLKQKFSSKKVTDAANNAAKPKHHWLNSEMNIHQKLDDEDQRLQSQRGISKVFRPTNVNLLHRPSNVKVWPKVQRHPSPDRYSPLAIQNKYTHPSTTSFQYLPSPTHRFKSKVVHANNWHTHVQPIASSTKTPIDDWLDITEPVVHYPIISKSLYDREFHTALSYLKKVLKYDTGENGYRGDWFWPNPAWHDPSTGPYSFPTNFSYPNNRLIFEGFTQTNFKDFQGRGDDIENSPRFFVFPNFKLCSERIRKGFKFEDINYYLSTEDPEHTYLDRAGRYREPELFTWLEALNVCRRRCMTPIAFEDELKFQVFGRLMVHENIQRIWTGGKLCNSRDCRDFHLMNPLSIFGWTWVGSAGPIPRIDRTPEGFTSRPWSSKGPLGCAQPDNAEFYVRNETESCVALLNNEYNDGVKLHDLACYHKLPVMCQEDERIIKYAENIFNVQLPRYP